MKKSLIGRVNDGVSYNKVGECLGKGSLKICREVTEKRSQQCKELKSITSRAINQSSSSSEMTHTLYPLPPQVSDIIVCVKAAAAATSSLETTFGELAASALSCLEKVWRDNRVIESVSPFGNYIKILIFL